MSLSRIIQTPTVFAVSDRLLKCATFCHLMPENEKQPQVIMNQRNNVRRSYFYYFDLLLVLQKVPSQHKNLYVNHVMVILVGNPVKLQ